ncbi:receptor-type guanylate cyclase Gyc76C-like [Daphnia carinata]|uniref:receptor-type guanylate cyclase Gyc76C-like n=1 Tax=Daphnia carinata TaxID=120202 RepID=UPI00257AC558|nr:receptor-type guanylate cyclase Gyc76C-like [Daphnia carinata]
MTIDGGHLLSSFLGIWLIGPVLICVASLFVLVMCFRRVEANDVKPETSILDQKDFFGLHWSKFSDSDAQQFDCNSIYSHNNSCSRMWIKSITLFNYKQLQLPPRLQKELSLLQKLHHTNINPLVGALLKDQKLYLVTPYCQLGTLQELLSSVNISFRKPVITSLIQDLICGVTYIHYSSIKCHGRLKSSNCLLNSYLRLKISDFGINQLRELTQSESSSTLIDRLWLAPEILRNQDCGASCEADMYAFAVILHEIIHRQGPFNVNSTTTIDVSLILDRIQQGPNLNTVGHVEYFRPQIKDDSNLEYGCPSFIRRCLEDCWSEVPSLRPNADFVFCQLSVLKNETCSQMAYDTDHELVDLKKEKEKKAKLLSSIIPSHAANQLVKGLRVKPQVFESVTLLFTNIGNFLQISEISSPHEHIRLLDDIYNIFDSVVQGYHVYKVETVKDTYFVASGLFPRKNHHTVEAALLALNLLNSIRAYKVPHIPHLAILLRIGMHLGPVAAGVIGLDKPRFCLFGDTVNVTSRLSTTGEPSQIQISSECHVALSRMGGFIMKERGIIYIKGKGWLKTYWLLGREPTGDVSEMLR